MKTETSEILRSKNPIVTGEQFLEILEEDARGIQPKHLTVMHRVEVDLANTKVHRLENVTFLDTVVLKSSENPSRSIIVSHCNFMGVLEFQNCSSKWVTVRDSRFLGHYSRIIFFNHRDREIETIQLSKLEVRGNIDISSLKVTGKMEVKDVSTESFTLVDGKGVFEAKVVDTDNEVLAKQLRDLRIPVCGTPLKKDEVAA